MDYQNYMYRAFELALKGKGNVSPNPMVGCVIVHNEKIIGEGWHKKHGEAHAEVNAIADVEDKRLLAESDVFVSLEPCAHYGKTPPCADLLIRHKVKKVIISVTDPNPLVGGKGIIKLRDSGIEVETGVLESEGYAINKRFFTAIVKKRPYVILKWAETADGFTARKNFDSKWISSAYSRKLVHKWRAEEDAILVGSNTAAHDNPQLSTRDWIGRNPVRIVIDRNLKLKDDLLLFDNFQPTLCYNLLKNLTAGNNTFVKLDQENFIAELLHDLYQKNIHSVIIEGGATVLNEFIRQHLWDEARIFKADTSFGEGIAAPRISGELSVEDTLAEGDRLMIYTPNKL